MPLELLIVLLLILANGVLAMAEFAIVSARKAQLQERAGMGDARARVALELAQRPTHFLATVQVGITLIGTLAGAFGGVRLASDLSRVLKNAPLVGPYSDFVALALVVMGITYLLLVLGELVPKRLALAYPETYSVLVARPMRLLSRLAAPIVWLLSVSTEGVLKLMGKGDLKQPEVTEAEILALIGQGKHSGVLEKLEADLVLRTLKAGDLMVREIMTHRTDIVWVDHDMKLQEFIDFNARQYFSHFPVRGPGPDEAAGVVSVKDIMHAAVLGKLKPGEPVSKVMQSPFLVLETREVLPLVVAMRDQDRSMAIMIDEFGGVSGLVTFKQLVSEVMGRHRTREEADRVRWVGANVLEVDAALRVGEANERLGLKIPEGDYDTLAGFVIAQLGHMPEQGESITHEGIELKVASLDGLRVEKLRVVMPQDRREGVDVWQNDRLVE